MAKGLRKLIKNAQRNSFTNRLKKQRASARLRVVELEDRIAPAFVLAAGEYIPYDTDGGIGILYNAGATDVTVDITDGGAASVADEITIDLDTAGAVSLMTNAAITSGSSATALITDSANCSLTFATGRTGAQLNLDGGATLAAAGVFTYFDGAADPGTNAAPVAGAAATRTDGQVDAASDLNANVTGGIVLNNDAAASDLTALTIANAGAGTDDGDFDGVLTVRDDVVAVTIDGTATGAWTITGSVTGNISVGSTAATTDIAIGGDLGDGAADTFATTNGAIAGDIIVTGDIVSSITGDDGISGAISAGDILDNIVATTGNISGTITTTAAGTTGNGAITGAITATAGTISANVTAVGDISGNITADDDISGDITADTISGNITATTGNISGAISTTGAGTYGTGTGAIASIEATAGAITGGITTTDGSVATDLANVTSITAGNGITTTAITIDGDLGNLDVTGDVSVNIDVDGTIGDVDISGDLSAVITAADGFTGDNDRTIDGDITAAGALIATTGGFADPGTATLTIGTGLAGNVTATAGDIDCDITISAGGLSGAITATAGNINGAIVIVDSGTDDGTLTGLITATAGDVGVVTIADGITATGAIIAGDVIDGLITITEGGLAVGGSSTTGIIRAANDIEGGVTIVDGGLAGTIRAVAGDIKTVAITVTNGGVAATGAILAGNDISANVTISDDGLAGTITADNDLSGAIAVTGGIAATASIEAGRDLGAGGITVATGNLTAGATVTAGRDITGNITVATGNIAANITATEDISGNIEATLGSVTGTVTASLGDLSGNVTAGSGNITSIVVGDDLTGDVLAEDDITAIAVTGAITGSTITASNADVDGTGNIGTITAGDGINATIAAVNISTIRSGGLSTEKIEGTITATGDIDLVDAGAGSIDAVVTAQTAVPGSPLATFISSGYSYAVWAISGAPVAGVEPTADAGVSAELIFDGNGNGAGSPTLEINNLAGTSATTRIYVTSRVDTGAEQLFWDSDVDVYDAPIELTALTASSAITVGTLYVEGSFTDLGGDSDITISNIVVEGGVGGTIAVAAGDDIDFGWVEASLTINVAGAGVAGDLILRSSAAPGSTAGYAINGGATVLVNGSLSNVYLGDSSAGFVGDLGTNATVATLTATGAIGDIFVDGDVLGNIRGTSLGDIEIDGYLGDDVDNHGIAASIDVTASTGSIGDVKVDGNIGGDDDGETVTIQAVAAAGNIGAVNATGNIGTVAEAGAAVDTSVTISAGGNIDKVEATGNIGDFDTDAGGADVDTAVIITATNGTIGSVMADGAIGINANITAGDDIGTVFATNETEDNGEIGGTILSYNGDITAVNTFEADITANVTAVNGNIGQVAVLDVRGLTGFAIDAGDVTGDITAGGDIDLVAGADITGTIIAGAATAASPVTQFVFGDYNPDPARNPVNATGDSVKFEINATAGALYGYTFDATNYILNLTIDNWDGAAARAAGAINVSLNTSQINMLADSGEPYAADFNLASLDFTAASIANDVDNLGTVTVEGDINVLDTGTMTALIAEGNVQGPIVISRSAAAPLTAFAAGSVSGVGTPLLSEMEDVFENLSGGAITFGAPTDGTVFTVPVSSGADVSFAFGTATGLAGNAGFPVVLSASIESFLVTVSGGAVTDIEGTVMDSGTVFVYGDLTWDITAESISSLVITGNVVAGADIYANNIGTIEIGRDIAQYISQNGAFADTAAAQAWLTANGNFGGTITSDEVVVNGAVVAGSEGNIGNVTIYGNYTGSIVADGNVGAVSIGQSLADVDGTKIAYTGSMTGSLSVEGNLTSLTAERNVVAAGTSFIAVGGNSGNITSTEGNIGGSGLIMVGGNLGNVTAPAGNISADIFTGGTVGTLEAIGFAGDWLFGAVAGETAVTINDKLAAVDATPRVYTISTGAASVIDIDADTGLTSTGLTIDRITLFADSAAVSLTSNDDAVVNVTEVFVVENTVPALDFTVDGNIGTIVAANGNILVVNSDTLANNFLAAYNTQQGTSISLDVVNAANLPSALDAQLNDYVNVPLTATIVANSVTGVIATGALDVTVIAAVGMDDFGYLVSLNSTVTANIYANDSIGSIAASGNIVANLDTEGVIAIDDASAMQTAVTTTYGLNGLPSWFDGGILSEIGSIAINANADGDQIQTDDLGGLGGIPIGQGYAMGTIYAMLGEVTGQVDLGASFGGIVAPWDNIGSGITVNVPLTSVIDRFVAPYSYDNTVDGDHPDAQLTLLYGQTLVTPTNPYAQGDEKVQVSGTGMLLYVDPCDINGCLGDVYVIAGLANTASVIRIQGDVETFTVNGNWGGTVQLQAIPNDDGTVLGDIDDLVINGDVLAATAVLIVNEFESYDLNGDVVGTKAGNTNYFSTGSLTSTTKSVTWTNQANDAQTLYAKVGKNMAAGYNIFFGELTSVAIAGRGSASIASVNETLSASNATQLKTLNTIVKNATKGDTTVLGGTAHIGSLVANDWYNKVSLKGVVIEGNNNNLNVDGQVTGLKITGSAEDIQVSRSINMAFLNGSLDSLKSDKLTKVYVDGSIDEYSAIDSNTVYISGSVTDMSGVRMNKVAVDGDVHTLWIQSGTAGSGRGALINSRFNSVSHENIDNRRYIPWSDSVAGGNGGNADADNNGDDGNANAGDGGDSAIVGFNKVLNPYYNPVKVIRTFAPGLNPWSSDELPQYQS